MKKIIIVENDEIISNDKEVAEVLNTFFSNIVSNLNIPEYPINDPFIDNINDPILKAIFKCKNHPSIKAIEKVSKLDKLFNFNKVDKEEVLKEIIGLKHQKRHKILMFRQKLLRKLLISLHTLSYLQLMLLLIMMIFQRFKKMQI